MGEQALPGGSFYDNVDPWVYLWLYYSFEQDREDNQKFTRSMAIFQGSFYNPEMARDIIRSETPTAEMDDEQFDAVSEYILTEHKKEESKLKKRQRKILNNK